MKYAFIQQHRRVWPIRVQCRVLRVSVAGYHEHFVRRAKIALRRHLSEEALLVRIRAVYAENRGAYGWPRIWRQLRAEGVRVGKRRVQRLMQRHGIRARGKRQLLRPPRVHRRFRRRARAAASRHNSARRPRRRF